VLQSLLLSASALVQAIPGRSVHLFIVAGLAVVARAVVIPWLLRRTLHGTAFTRREIDQTLRIPTSLLIAAALVLLAYFVTQPLLVAADGAFVATSLPLGLSVLLLGAYTVSVRREAVPQILGVLTAENGVFFAGLAIAGRLPIIVEIAVALDVVIVAVVLGLLTRRIHERTGSTVVADLSSLKEG
jgi:hydrogenase-4 component E